MALELGAQLLPLDMLAGREAADSRIDPLI